MKYNFEIGLHFKKNVTLKQKQSFFKDLEEYTININEKNYINKEIKTIFIYTKQIEEIKRILSNSKLLRYFYIDGFRCN